MDRFQVKNQYTQDDSSERYSEPFRSIARIISLIPAKGRKNRARIKNLSKIWFKYFCKPFHRHCIFPDVLLIGASKCGSSSMAAHLSSHPDCMPPFFKEPRYFDSSRIPAKRINTYRAYFPTSARRGLKEFFSGRRAWTADFSPTYYDNPHAPRRVFETLGPDVKLILLLRNPVDRAFSQYRFHKGSGNESEETFERALDLEESRIAGEAEKELLDESYFSRPRNRFGYVNRGLYLPYIKNWHKYYNPSQLLVVTLEDFSRSPQQVFNEICDFIGVPHHAITNHVHNVSKEGQTMSAVTRSKLLEYFREHNRALANYLGRDFDWEH